MALLTACAVTAAAANLDTFTPVNIINGWAINSSGEIVGYAGGHQRHRSRLFLQRRRLTDLQSGRSGQCPSWTGKAYGTNDSGTIVGQANNSNIRQQPRVRYQRRER